MREARIAELEKLMKGLKLGWGGVEKGNIVTMYFEEKTYRFRGLPPAEFWLNLWFQQKRTHYRRWLQTYDWICATAYPDSCTVYKQRQAARRKWRQTR
jgi:hypothetical protein